MEWWTVLGTVFAGIAAIGVWPAMRAVQLQKRSLRLQEAQESRDLEPHDVSWVPLLKHEWTFTQIGTLPVTDVNITLTVDDKTSVHSFDRVSPREVVVAPNKGNRENLAYRHANARRREDDLAELDAREAALPEFLASSGLSGIEFQRQMTQMEFPIKADIRVIIVWRYPSGRSDRQQLSWTHDYSDA